MHQIALCGISAVILPPQVLPVLARVQPLLRLRQLCLTRFRSFFKMDDFVGVNHVVLHGCHKIQANLLAMWHSSKAHHAVSHPWLGLRISLSIYFGLFFPAACNNLLITNYAGHQAGSWRADAACCRRAAAHCCRICRWSPPCQDDVWHSRLVALPSTPLGRHVCISRGA